MALRTCVTYPTRSRGYIQVFPRRPYHLGWSHVPGWWLPMASRFPDVFKLETKKTGYFPRRKSKVHVFSWWWDFFKREKVSSGDGKKKCSRWLKVTFLSPSWRSLNLWKGHLTIPKRSQRIARSSFFWQNPTLKTGECPHLSWQFWAKKWPVWDGEFTWPF